MKNILFVGQNPIIHSGNGNMLAAVLAQVDDTKYKVASFISGGSQIGDPFELSNVINAEEPNDGFGFNKLLKILKSSSSGINYLVMVGLDIWTYAPIFDHILSIKKEKPFCWITIFPWDLYQLRADWIRWINYVDIPCVYSKYGYDLLKDHIPALQYFKPPLWKSDLYKQYTSEKARSTRHKYFKEVSDSRYIIGCVAKNQIRKDIPKLVAAFLSAKKENPKLVLYLHTELKGVYNLKQMAYDMGARTGDVIAKKQGVIYSEEQMADIYNSIDCLINCSAQEGLSWTVLQAMACGTPVIGSRTTAQTELLEDAGTLITPKEILYIPVITQSGESHVSSLVCTKEDIKIAILDVSRRPDLQIKMKESGLKRSKEWLSDVSDINDILKLYKPSLVKSKPKIDKVLFIQHSSAGDVLMTTQCFKGIKERHPDKKLVYMTQPQYQDIIRDNPYIDEIIDWDIEKADEYLVKYNPHGEHILPGQFNNGDTPLYAMYPYFCKVEADNMFIEEKSPSLINTEDDYDEDDRFEIDYNEWPKKYIVVHTTGGDPKYRTYKHMDIVVKNIGLPVVQIGGTTDMVCHEASFDLRGKLSWRETAWVVKRAEAIIAVDSFPVHLAGALGTPVVGLFGPAPARVTGCRGNPKKIINIEPDRLKVCKTMAACYGRRTCNSPCINTISPHVVRKALNRLLESERKIA
jgi:ADP-heptose:LPS heptosyltransferase/glycosyltransferase involved in cell wall biosynthesis